MFRRLLGHEKTPQADCTRLRTLGGAALTETGPKTYKSFQDILRESGWEDISESITAHAAAAVKAGWGSEAHGRFESLWGGLPEGTAVKINPSLGVDHLDGQLRMVWRHKESIKKELREEDLEEKITHDAEKVGNGWAEIEPCFGFQSYRNSAFRNPCGCFDEVSFPYMSFITSRSRIYTEQLVALRVSEQGEPLFQLQLTPPESLSSE